ncbi:MAG: glycerol-3-phosphate 1-O-acyltransferase PlsY [Candidatus Baltobacteraceae bacterium]
MAAAVLLIAAIPYLIGSIPFGLIVGSLFYNKDLRRSGSGNIGAMNALRTIGKAGAAAVLVLDAAKGIVPVAAALALSHDLRIGALVAAAAVLGHCFSPWLRFSGGKGVATALGALFALCWPAGVLAIAVWLAGALLTTYSSVGSIAANVSAPFALWYFTRDPWVSGYGAFAALLILYTHRSNLRRLRAHQEQGIPFLRRNGRGS